MGVWSIPWDNEAKAKTFAAKIKEGVQVEVEKTSSGELEIKPNAVIGFRFHDECLFGSDELVDIIHDKAMEVNGNFDATEMVTEVVESMLKNMEQQPELPKNLEAVNIVRESIGLEELTADRKLSKSSEAAQRILSHFKENDIAIEYSDLNEFKAPLNPIIKMMNRIPDGVEADVIYGLTIETVEKKEFELDFKDIPEVKGFGYDRPGLLRICFI